MGELAQLLVSDIATDAATGVTAIEFSEDESRGKRLKTLSSRRLVPVHPELKRIGFLQFVERVGTQAGEDAPLFSMLHQGAAGGHAAQWTKWFGRYVRQLGIRKPVFHSFRHGFKDALRAAGESEDINDALTGHSRVGVGHRYGAKEMARRFGLQRLADAVAKVDYTGLDLSHLKWVPKADSA